MAEIKRSAYKVHNGTDYDELRFRTDADLVELKDINGKFTATNTEGALEELDDKLGSLSGDIEALETKTADYNFSVTSTDANGKPIQTKYTRTDTTLYRQVDASNPDANGNYQTVIEKYYDVDGTTLLKTDTWTITYNADGLVTGRTVVES